MRLWKYICQSSFVAVSITVAWTPKNWLKHSKIPNNKQQKQQQPFMRPTSSDESKKPVVLTLSPLYAENVPETFVKNETKNSKVNNNNIDNNNNNNNNNHGRKTTTTTTTTTMTMENKQQQQQEQARNHIPPPPPPQKEKEWDHYPISVGDPHFLFSEEYYNRRSAIDQETILQYLVPIVAPIFAFGSYDIVAGSFSSLISYLANNNWVPVDGGSLQATILTPTINGIVLPAISVLFATLTSTTISTLRHRQQDIRQALYVEAGELRAMEYLVAEFPNLEMQASCRQYLLRYASRIIAESQPDWRSHTMQANALPGSSSRGWMDSELHGVLKEVTEAPKEMTTLLQDQSYQAVTRLRQARQNRLTALQSTYPPLHYGILAVLASGTCTGFLMEADQELLFFLNAIQLKILWSMLVGTFVACFAVFYDLLNPFSGCYQITTAVDQLYTIRQGLKASIQFSLLDYGKEEECRIYIMSNDDNKDNKQQQQHGQRKEKKTTNEYQNEEEQSWF